ncbi:hypothetical protein BG015_000025 [Linnemannia schmuckeri]|uniref:Uncharacterized protein n=1 Tax=Linnemannia schmuckeri TaxID=64567 RepID=A0A9P5SBD1_9FUNG|nr:hypothetical protein BG015_000025 [Linnemannia schmuckeri]
MAKEKKSRQQPEAAKDAPHNADIYAVPVDTTASHFPASDTASHYSKETTTSDHRKSKSWTKSLKKATNSILYMAMPPTSVDHVPMIVAQTPMSPDRLIPTVHSPILQSSASSIMTFAPTDSSTTMSLISAPISTSTTITAPFRPVSETAASSTASVTTASIASSLSTSQRSHHHHTNNNHWDASAATGFLPEQPESSGIAVAHTNNQRLTRHTSSSTTSSTSTLTRTIGKGKERAEPLHLGDFYDGIGTEVYAASHDYEDSQRTSLVSPPSSPPSQTNYSDSPTNGHHSLTTFVIETTAAVEPRHEENQEALPSPPLSPINVLQKHDKAHSVSRKKHQEIQESYPEVLEVQEVIQARSISHSTTRVTRSAEPQKAEIVSVETREFKQELLPAIPDNISRFSFALDPDSESALSTTAFSTSEIDTTSKAAAESPALPEVETRQDIVFVSYEDEPEPLPPVRTAPLPPIPQLPQLKTPPQRVETSISAPIPQKSSTTTSIRENARKELTIDVGAPSPPSVCSSTTTAASNTRKQMTRSMVMDAAGFPMVPPRALALTRSLSKRNNAKPQPVKKAPWLWHQDGIHQQRLESHQILTKEQVFEQYHLDLETEGPNGFFLFKLVKKFKRQDPSLEAISSTLLDSEITASPVSNSPSSPTPTSILDNLDAASVSQKLKRQLLLQKRKKQRGSKSSSDSEEEDHNLEALLNMSNHNTSLQNLNSSLQEVIDAVDSLKESQEWTSLLDRPQDYAHQRSQKPIFPDSDGEYTSKDKDPAQIDALERRRGVYSTGRTDGTNLISKKKHKALQRRSSVSTTPAGTVPGAGSRKGSSGPLASGLIDPESGPQEGSSVSNDRRGSEAAAAADGGSQFKKQAIAQLHIYSRNGLKFKFDVMQDNELHFVEASKKYTFMDPLAAHRQPNLERSSSSRTTLSPLNSPTSDFPPPLPPHHPNGSSNGRRTSSATTVSTVSDHNRVTIAPGSAPHRSSSTRSKSTLGSSSGGRRVFVTRLGRHTLLTYPEYKVLAKSASGFTLGAKLLLQRSIAVATPSFHGKDSSTNQQQQQNNGYDVGTPISPTKNSFATPTPSSTATNGTGESDYFSLKKKPRAITGFASKAVAAIKSPSTPGASSNSKVTTPRPIVTPYNPAEYKNKTLAVSANAPIVAAVAEEPSSLNGTNYTQGVDIPRSSDSSNPMLPTSPSPLDSSSPPTPANLSSSPPPMAIPSSSSSSNPYSSTIKRQGNQAGLKFQHLFITVHQRLQKLELDNGVSFYGSPLVQWTVIEDPAELRWWRDKIGIQMIGRLEGDELLNGGSPSPSALGGSKSQHLQQQGTKSALSSAISVRSSYVSAQSTISDASSSSSLSSSTYRSQVSVERLGYRFLRVSGHMGTLKVTVSEQVEARAVALAVQAEMLRQKRVARLQQLQQQGRRPSLGDDLLTEQPWVELTDTFENPDDDYVDEEDEDESFEEDSEIDGSSGDEEARRLRHRQQKLQRKRQQRQQQEKLQRDTNGGGGFYDMYEYDEFTGRTHLKKEPSMDRFSRRKRHERAAAKDKKNKQQQPLIERMTMIVGQAKVFKGDWYMKNVYKFHV